MALQLLLGPSTQHFHSHFRGYSNSHVERVSAGQGSCPSLRMDSGCLDDNTTYPTVTLQLGSPLIFYPSHFPGVGKKAQTGSAVPAVTQQSVDKEGLGSKCVDNLSGSDVGAGPRRDKSELNPSFVILGKGFHL